MLVDKHESAVFDGGGRTHADAFFECTHTRAPKGAKTPLLFMTSVPKWKGIEYSVFFGLR